MSFDVEFGTKDQADEIREEYDEYVCPVDDDLRLKEVAFVDATPPQVEQDLETFAAAGRAERGGGAGQAPLTDGERNRIDFSKPGVNVLKYRSIKGIAQSEGVDDWLAYADPTLTVDEHRDTMKRAARDEGGGQRMDVERSDEERAADLPRQRGSGDCDHARGHCKHGDPDACEFLQVECGLDEDDLSALVEQPAPKDNAEEPEGAALGALKRSWQGYKGAISALDELLDDVRDEWEEAQQAARAINSVRDGHGQEPLHFAELEERQGRLTDLVRKASADCHECHSVHSRHDHAVDTGAREELEDFLRGDAADTPVGVGEDNDD
jgi:hypothetical protein